MMNPETQLGQSWALRLVRLLDNHLQIVSSVLWGSSESSAAIVLLKYSNTKDVPGRLCSVLSFTATQIMVIRKCLHIALIEPWVYVQFTENT